MVSKCREHAGISALLLGTWRDSAVHLYVSLRREIRGDSVAARLRKYGQFLAAQRLRTTSSLAKSDIEVGYGQRVLLDELTPRLDLIAHQRREDVVRGDRVLDLHLHEAAAGR